MTRNQHDLQLLLTEAAVLSNKVHFTKADERRNSFLLSAISLLKGNPSLTLAEISQAELNTMEAREGFKQTRINRVKLSEEREQRGRFMQKLVRCEELRGPEFRGETEGNLTTAIGSYTGMGALVPTDCYNFIFGAMAQHDSLYDDECVTLINSTNARPMAIGSYDDIDNVAILITESADLTGQMVPLGSPGISKLGAWSYRTPIHRFSTELFDDLAEAANAYDLFSNFAADRLARGAGSYLINGSGSNQTQGLLTSLVALGVQGITAAGSGANTGGAETGITTVGSADLAKCYMAVNRAWREQSDKVGWLMNDTTLQMLAVQVSKQGLPLISYLNGVPTLMGKRIFPCPSMPSPGSGNVPIIFGATNQWITRVVSDELTRVRILRETYATSGEVGLQMFARIDGCLCYQGEAEDAPFSFIQCHS